MVNAVSVVAQSFYEESNNGRKDNNYLRNWVSWNFKGNDGVSEEVARKLQHKFNRIIELVIT
jgi:hypothetical protein